MSVKSNIIKIYVYKTKLIKVMFVSCYRIWRVKIRSYYYLLKQTHLMNASEITKNRRKNECELKNRKSLKDCVCVVVCFLCTTSRGFYLESC
jgi:hypothetical protein